ncbi:MAG: hypothetical protein Q8N53_25090 [Longimicrobiales bacterium]|nr:hypothetical protein [Longimicrobiales bacterium]
MPQGAARRLVGALLLILVLPPWYRLVDSRGGGAAAEQTLRLGSAYTLELWTWSVLGIVGVLLLGWLLPPGLPASLWSRVRQRILSVRLHSFGLALALVATGAALWTSAAVLDGMPVLIDGVGQLVQARYLAAGMLSGPRLAHPEFWQFQFMVLTDAGWVSQYPPGFSALLAAGWRLGAAWLVGPGLLGVAVYLTALIADRLFPSDPVVARMGAVLATVSPLLIFHAAGYMSHVLALALLTVALYASLRAVEEGWAWSLVTGAALGGMLATRPYTAVVLGFFATVVVWSRPPQPQAGLPSARAWALRLAGLAAGAGPFILALLLFNAHFFGAATRFGYVAAAGPAHGLGFHVDPWGSPYGFVEAVGYTSADLVGLSSDLLQAPIPWMVVVSLYLLLAQRLGRGAFLASMWAMLPVLGNAFYWHHDLFMGPRLLYEAVPGWCLLLAASAAWSVRALPKGLEGRVLGGVGLRSGASAVFALGLVVGVLYAGPQKLASYRATPERPGLSVRAPAVDRPALVFVHGSWEERLGSRLAALGMRLDSVRLALRHNSSCHAELSLAALEGGVGVGSSEPGGIPLAFEEHGGPQLRELRMPSGSVIRTYEGETLDPRCERQAASDFQGIVDLVPLIWQGDLPGLGSTGAMFVRDFGPERNARLLEEFPGREPKLLTRNGTEIRLMPYEDAVAGLWPGA